MNIENVMTPDPRVCAPDDSLQEAAQLMWTHDVGVLPVVDAEGRAVGVVTDRDIAMHAAIMNTPLSKLAVSGCMSGNLWSCKPTDSLSSAERLFRQHQVHRLVVMEEGVLKGIVSMHDIARAVRKHKDEHPGVLETYGAISRPRTTQLAHA